MSKLTEFERFVIEGKGTERPFSGEYHLHDAKGVYLCKRCDAPLYRSESKFNAHCGWPAFDDEIKGAVQRVADSDGIRVEIICAACGGHLGHVFEGEYLTDKNVRHCVNSVSLRFKSSDEINFKPETSLATFGGGCFWCIEAIFSELNGVTEVDSGYSGGDAETANYKDVCSASTGHAEVIQVKFEPDTISFDELLEVFWMSHDPTTLNQQGNDVGPQYRSAIFAHDAQQVDSANRMIKRLTETKVWDRPIVTEVTAFQTFYPAENYHKDYFELNGEQSYCQMVIKPKVDKFRLAFATKLK